MVAICGANPIFLPGPAKPPLFTHDSMNFLMINQPPFPFELFGNAAVSINENRIRRFFLRLIVVGSSGKIHQFAPPFKVFDEGAIFGNELSFF